MCMNSCRQQTFCVPYQSTKGWLPCLSFLFLPSTKYYTEYKNLVQSTIQSINKITTEYEK